MCRLAAFAITALLIGACSSSEAPDLAKQGRGDPVESFAASPETRAQTQIVLWSLYNNSGNATTTVGLDQAGNEIFEQVLRFNTNGPGTAELTVLKPGYKLSRIASDGGVTVVSQSADPMQRKMLDGLAADARSQHDASAHELGACSECAWETAYCTAETAACATCPEDPFGCLACPLAVKSCFNAGFYCACCYDQGNVDEDDCEGES